jgi:hypothetical protein
MIDRFIIDFINYTVIPMLSARRRARPCLEHDVRCGFPFLANFSSLLL